MTRALLVATLLNLLVLRVAQLTLESEAFIKVTRFQVPPVVRVGDTVKILCHYKLSGETLQAMKLFKDDDEFYRYTPASRPSERKKAFNVTGINVDLANSNEREVLLKRITKKSAGLFRCKVVVEDTFKSITVESRMNVSASGLALDPSGSVVGAPRFSPQQAGGNGGGLRHTHGGGQRHASAAAVHKPMDFLDAMANGSPAHQPSAHPSTPSAGSSSATRNTFVGAQQQLSWASAALNCALTWAATRANRRRQLGPC